MSAKTDIERLVSDIAQAVLQPNVTLEAKIDALKVLNPYYSLLARGKAKMDEEPSDGPSFGDFRAGLKESEQDHPNGSHSSPIRSHRRS